MLRVPGWAMGVMGTVCGAGLCMGWRVLHPTSPLVPRLLSPQKLRPQPEPSQTPAQTPSLAALHTSTPQEVQAPGQGPAGPTLPSHPARDTTKPGKTGEPKI